MSNISKNKKVLKKKGGAGAGGQQPPAILSIVDPDDISGFTVEELGAMSIVKRMIESGKTPKAGLLGDYKAERRWDMMRAAITSNPKQVARALAVGDIKSLESLASILQYSSPGSTRHTKLFLAKLYDDLGSRQGVLKKDLYNALSKFRKSKALVGVDVEATLGLLKFKRAVVEVEKVIADSGQIRAGREYAYTKSRYLRENRANQPMVQKVRVDTDVLGTKTATIIKGLTKVTRMHRRTMNTMDAFSAFVLFEILPTEDFTFMPDLLKFRAACFDYVVGHYYGSGPITGQLNRLRSVIEYHKKSQAKKAVLDASGEERWVTPKGLVRYFTATLGPPRSVHPNMEIISKFPPSVWMETLMQAGVFVKPQNAQSDDGAPFHHLKKGQSVEASGLLLDEVYLASQTNGAKRLKNLFPHLGVIIIKPKEERYDLMEPWDPHKNYTADEFAEWVDMNTVSAKVRSIYIPYSGDAHRILMHLQSGSRPWAGNKGLQSYLAKGGVRTLKKFPWVGGTTDLLVRRFTGEYPFDEMGDEPIAFHYSDNINASLTLQADTYFMRGVMRVGTAHRKFKALQASLKDETLDRPGLSGYPGVANLQKYVIVKKGTRVAISLDGKRMESSSDPDENEMAVRAQAIHTATPEVIAKYQVRTAKLKTSGIGVDGDKAEHITWNCSGNPYTYMFNDKTTFFCCEDLLTHLDPNRTVINAERQGVFLTTERVVIMDDAGLPLSAGVPTEMDLLGFSIASMANVSDGRRHGLYVPVLEAKRDLASQCLAKQQEMTMTQHHSKSFALWLYGGWSNVVRNWQLIRAIKATEKTGATIEVIDLEGNEVGLDETAVKFLLAKGEEGAPPTPDLALVADFFSDRTYQVGQAVNIHKIGYDWAEPRANPIVFGVNDDDLYSPDRRHENVERLIRYLHANGLKAPVKETSHTKNGKIKAYTLDYELPAWKKILKFYGAKDDKARGRVSSFILNALFRDPSLSSNFAQESEQSAGISNKKKAVKMELARTRRTVIARLQKKKDDHETPTFIWQAGDIPDEGELNFASDFYKGFTPEDEPALMRAFESQPLFEWYKSSRASALRDYLTPYSKKLRKLKDTGVVPKFELKDGRLNMLLEGEFFDAFGLPPERTARLLTTMSPSLFSVYAKREAAKLSKRKKKASDQGGKRKTPTVKGGAMPEEGTRAVHQAPKTTKILGGLELSMLPEGTKYPIATAPTIKSVLKKTLTAVSKLPTLIVTSPKTDFGMAIFAYAKKHHPKSALLRPLLKYVPEPWEPTLKDLRAHDPQALHKTMTSTQLFERFNHALYSAMVKTGGIIASTTLGDRRIEYTGPNPEKIQVEGITDYLSV